MTKGLDIIDGKPDMATLRPAFAQPLKVAGNFQMTVSSRVSNKGLLVLHFLLKGMDPAGTPARILADYMRSYLGDEVLQYEEVVFDLANDILISLHAEYMKSLVHKMQYELSFWYYIVLTIFTEINIPGL